MPEGISAPKKKSFEGLVSKNESLDVSEETKNSILKIAEESQSFTDFIEKLFTKKLGEDNLIWHFVDSFLEDKDIKKKLAKWKSELRSFNSVIEAIYTKLKLKKEDCLICLDGTDVYIRPKEGKSIAISDVLRNGDEGKVYYIHLGGGVEVATKREGNKRYYTFTGPDSSSCIMTISWKAKGSDGKDIDCSMEVKVGPNGIEDFVSKPTFGGLSLDKILELAKQNEEVYINGKTLYQDLLRAFPNMDKGTGKAGDETFGGYSSAPTPPRNAREEVNSIPGSKKVHEQG
ncbi:hypothetical protein [Wolbachia endosymbiont of Ctenocephalides felis wCfeT]|uniref:hypothetical protein n=1 Tax=Wolbachia endosymbiont of Ctenocephalides felis wCfeT TaxID=2732593 RepID=UPI00144633EB|nr:hypothetical protein [Wolbachia endosymbiont of Ctenocephalides felis wCfeT]